jgi:hypothetical protein
MKTKKAIEVHYRYMIRDNINMYSKLYDNPKISWDFPLKSAVNKKERGFSLLFIYNL